MKGAGAEVLAWRAKSVGAKHYLINEIDKMTEQYHRACEKCEVGVRVNETARPGDSVYKLNRSVYVPSWSCFKGEFKFIANSSLGHII